MNSHKSGKGSTDPHRDAAGQFAPSQADRAADGVASAKPTVVTGCENATAHRDPPRQEAPEGLGRRLRRTPTRPVMKEGNHDQDK